MSNHQGRICVCYLITTFLLSSFVYILLSTNYENSRTLKILRQEVDDITHFMLRTPVPVNGKTADLAELVDLMLRKRLDGVWTDLYSMKKQLANYNRQTCPKRMNMLKYEVDKKATSIAVPRINYAASEFGAWIEKVVATPAAKPNFIERLLNMEYNSNPPINMLRQNMDPGNCFAFLGNNSEVTVHLSSAITVDTIEVEHISAENSTDVGTSSAPKSFSVYGIDLNKEEILLGHFIYQNAPKCRIEKYRLKTNQKFREMCFKFSSNHGNPNYTCVYRVGVYGTP